jgi:hypothetical protein
VTPKESKQDRFLRIVQSRRNTFIWALGIGVAVGYLLFSAERLLTTRLAPILSSPRPATKYVEDRQASPEEVAASKGQDNIKPDAGDVIISLPNNRRMVFRKVFLGVGNDPTVPKRFLMGNSHPSGGDEPMLEKPLTANLRGSFYGNATNGNLDAYYLMGKYDVTVDQFSAFSNAAPSKHPNDPMTEVSREDINSFIGKLNNWVILHNPEQLPKMINGQPAQFRLPTEPEWEFAARGGLPAIQQGIFNAKNPYGANPRRYENFRNENNLNSQLNEVARLNPNPLGLYDMLGNVRQIVYESPSEGTVSVERGAAFSDDDPDLVSASTRVVQPVVTRRDIVGFRLALGADLSHQYAYFVQTGPASLPAPVVAQPTQAPQIVNLTSPQPPRPPTPVEGKVKQDIAPSAPTQPPVWVAPVNPRYPSEWTTTDGQTFSKVLVMAVEADAVTIMHSNGVSTVDLAVLPPNLQRAFNYIPWCAQVAAAQRKSAEERADRDWNEEQQLAATMKIGDTSGVYVINQFEYNRLLPYRTKLEGLQAQIRGELTDLDAASQKIKSDEAILDHTDPIAVERFAEEVKQYNIYKESVEQQINDFDSQVINFDNEVKMWGKKICDKPQSKEILEPTVNIELMDGSMSIRK